MRFERAMKHLRAGAMIRRRTWLRGVYIARMANDVFLAIPADSSPPSPYDCRTGHKALVWAPYSNDFLASDWEVVNG